MTDQARPKGAPRRRRRQPRSTAPQHAVVRPDAANDVVDAAYVPTGFADLGVPEEIDRGLAAAGFSTPFAIQTRAIPVALTGRFCICSSVLRWHIYFPLL